MQYHLSELTRQLAFEDDGAAKDFCGHYGVHFTAENQIADRARFVDPEAAYAPRRAPNLIHSKRRTTLAEVKRFFSLNGAAVVDYKSNAVHCDFYRVFFFISVSSCMFRHPVVIF